MTASSLRICTVQRGTPSTPHLGFSDSWEFYEQEWGHWVWDVTSLHQVPLVLLVSHTGMPLFSPGLPVTMSFLQEAPGFSWCPELV